MVTSSASFAHDCFEAALFPDVSDLLKVTYANNEKNGESLKLHVVLPRDEYVTKPEKPFVKYDTQDLLLDTGSVGLILASKNHLSEDKFKHLVGGALITYGATEAAKIYFRNSDYAKLKSILTGVGATLLLGILKEARDKQGFGTPDINDVLYTSLGGALISVRFSINF